MSYTTFCASHMIAVSPLPVATRPDIALTNWSRNDDHWEVTVRIRRRKMVVYYTKDAIHEGVPPTLDEVLCCLSIDANTVESSADFETWADEFGRDPGDPQSRLVYDDCLKQNAKLKRLLGVDLYSELLNIEDTE